MGTWLLAPVFPTGDMAEDMVAALWHCPVPSPLVFGEQSFVTSHGMLANTSPSGLFVLQPCPCAHPQ